MKWEALLSEKRAGCEEAAGDGRDRRSGFEKDYHRIIVSSSFRRLQDKTQVFPLDRSDFIRTRLTHSLEVSSIGRSLAQNIGASLHGGQETGESGAPGMNPGFPDPFRSGICDILQCAGLIHDIGNPPFGHFGEEAIREWFSRHLQDLTFKGEPVRRFLTEQQYQDLLHFEGNAQGLRMVTKLDYPVQRFGMNLTYGLLSAVIKYPTASTEVEPGSKNVCRRKMGYFASEEELFRSIAAETGTGSARNPLALILEAADDIAYATADIEDAFKKGFFSYAAFMNELHERGVARPYREKLSDAYDIARLSGVMGPEEYAIRTWLRDMQDVLIVAATDGFTAHCGAIMDGSWPGELISKKPEKVLLDALKEIAYDYAFTSMSIFKTEIAANHILTYLLDILVPSALVYDSGDKIGLMEEKYLSLIPENYKQVYHRYTDGRAKEECVYERILLATDTISGMTDSYARDLYAELTGIRA